MTMDSPAMTPPPSAPLPAPSKGGGGTRAALVIVAILVVAAAVAGVVLATGGKKTPKPVVSSVTVLGKTETPWVDTGIDLVPTDDVAVTAKGFVVPNVAGSTVTASPDGVPNQPGLRQFNIIGKDTVDHSGLIAKIGDNGEPFVVGRSKKFKPSTAGRLLFGVNDIGLENNSGQFDVTVTVTHHS
jgi:hypothetical protein